VPSAALSRRSFLGGAVAGAVASGANFRSQTGTLGNWSTHSPDEFDWSGNDDGYFPVSRLRQQYLDYLAAKVLEYEEQKLSRHYYHGAHWTPEEIRVLRERRQPVITYNRIARKIDGIAGLLQRLRQDPKAYPRNPRNADGAEVATQCVRNILDGAEWQFLDNYAATQAAIEGIGGIELKLVEGDHGDPDITADFIFGDDFFYDPRSFKPDFSDARYMGIAKWLDVEAAIELFPDKEGELRTLMVETGFDLTTHSDREYKWVYVNEHRLRLVEHWYKHRGRWYWAFYCSFILLDQGVSPFMDERRRPSNRFIMFSAAVDHDGDRYGFTRNFKGPQDELNQRRSKALHISNVTKVRIQKGAVDDVETLRREEARPDGVVEYNVGFEKPDSPDKTQDLQAHLALMQDARSELDSFANINPAILAQDGQNEHSGVAINLLQKAGIAEIGSFLRNYRAWKIRVYRGVWNAIQCTWKSERYIRVTDNKDVAQFLTINKLDLNQWGQPTIVNAVGSLDVDMVLDEGPDNANLMQDAYEMIKDDPTIPWQIKLEFMPMPSSMKKAIEQKLAQAEQQAAQKPDPKMQGEMIKAQTAQGKGQAEIAKAKIQAQAELENARQDQQQKMLDARMQAERESFERQRIQMEMAQSREEHQFRIEELAEKRKTMQVQHAQRRKQAAQRPKPQRKAA
jgi:hypothetical protein